MKGEASPSSGVFKAGDKEAYKQKGPQSTKAKTSTFDETRSAHSLTKKSSTKKLELTQSASKTENDEVMQQLLNAEIRSK